MENSQPIVTSDIYLYGAPIDMAINEKGDAAILTESEAFVISFPRSRGSKEFSCVSLPTCYEFLGFRSDIPFMIGRRIWWLPSTPDFDRILLFTMNLQWILYKRKKGLLQWFKCGKFSPDLDKHFGNVRSFWSHSFVDMVTSGFVTASKEYQDVCEFKRESEPSSVDVAYVIDYCTMPDEYYLGRLKDEYVKMRKTKSKRKRKKAIKIEVLNSPSFCSENEESNNHLSVHIKEEEGRPIVKQLTKTSSTGEKRLVTYILDGKQGESETVEDEEKVNCVCGATEENSSEDEEWVECELCHTWMHVDCVAYFPEVQDYYHCDNCLKKEKKDNPEKKKSKRGRKKKVVPPETAQPQKDVRKDAAPVKTAKTSAGASAPNLPKIKSPIRNNELTTSSHDESDEVNDNSDSSYGMIHRGNHINCPCGASDSESGEEWVQCDECDKWQHQNCVNYASEDITHYQCPSCKQILSFFANKNFKAPIMEDSLAAKNQAKKEKFRIPKLSKANDDGFKVVGTSNCVSSMVTCQLQPIYIPKSVDESFLSELHRSIVKTATTDTTTTANSTSSQNDEISFPNSDNSQNPSNHSQPDPTDSENITNGTNHALNDSSVEEDVMPQGPPMFAFVLCTDSIIILQGYTNTQFKISSLYSVPDRHFSSMAVLGNPENTIQTLALVDYNCNDVLLWTMKFVDESGVEVKSENIKHFPTLILTDETVLSTGPDCISRVKWLNETKLLACKMDTIICYDINLMESCWTTEIALDFMIDWSLQSDCKLLIFDNAGTTSIIDTNSGEIIQEVESGRKNEIFINTAISPSELTRYDVKMRKNTSLAYTLPCSLTISANKSTHLSSNVSQSKLSWETLYFTPSDDKNAVVQPSFEISQDEVCQICNCNKLSFSGKEFGLTCSNNHDMFVDPITHAVLSPFSASECSNCGVMNREAAEKCGVCKLKLENLRVF